MQGMRTILLLSFILCYSFISGQVRTVKGEVRDRITGKLLSGVKIAPDFFGNDTTGKTGRFKIYVAKNYRDTIVFSKPGYFPFYYRVKTPVPLQIFLTPSTMGIDTVFQPALEKCHRASVQVSDRKNHTYIEHASILSTDSLTIGITDEKGRSNILIPKTLDTLIIAHPDYATIVRKLKRRDKQGHLMLIFMDRVKLDEYDSVWRTNRNALQLCPFELFNTGLGIRYTRFIKNQVAVGIHATFYFQSLFTNRQPDNRYDGFKLAPFFRFYFFRNIYKGAFLETKLLGGYLSSDRIVYSMPDDDYSHLYTDSFWTYGIAFSVGYDWYLNEKVDLGFILGIQAFPNGAPKTIEYDGTTYERGSNSIFPLDNWYFAGPGSIIEMKFLIGGIF